MIMLELLFLAAANGSAPDTKPTRIVTEAFRTASEAYDNCLIEAAEKLAATEEDVETRYRIYSAKCSGERTSMINEWMRGNPSPKFDAGRASRIYQYEWALRLASDRAAIWAKFLDPGPQIIDPIPVTNVGNDASN